MSKKLNQLIEILVGSLQEVDDIAQSLLGETSLDTSAGSQLDGLGETVGENRYGRSDSEYRHAIRFRILINNSKGTPDEIIAAFALATGDPSFSFFEVYPAKVQIVSSLETLPDNLLTLMRQVVPAGVGIQIESPSYTPFRAGVSHAGDRLGLYLS